MTRRRLVLSAAGAFPLPAQDKPLTFAGAGERHQMIPMRDGARLSTYLYTPEGSGPWPVLYEQRYASLRSEATRRRYAALAARGYVVAAQNFRGTHLSEGDYQGYRALGWGKLRDGYDTVEWLARQPWSSGKVGTFGGSQAGYAQNFLAVTRPPHLAAQYIIDGGLSLFHLGYRMGGITRIERFKQGMLVDARDAAAGRRHLEDQIAHPDYDDYWRQEDCTLHFGKMNVPAFIIASWFDFMSRGSIDSYLGRQHQGGPGARGKQRLLIGPWLHGGTKAATRVGELELAANSTFAMDDHMIRWFDHYLKGKPLAAEPVVRYYVAGAAGEPGAPGNEWRSADDWPVPATEVPYYLASGGKLGTQPPPAGAQPTTYRSDPANPAPSPGRAEPTARDGRTFEAHPDVRSFTTEPLREAVEWTGDVRVELSLECDAPDTDVIVRVSDVYPGGRSILLIDNVRRARYRESFEKPSPLEAGRVYRIGFSVGWLSYAFAPGHRIRVAVAGTMADYFEPNPQTGEIPGWDPPAHPRVANVRLHHGGAGIAPSRVIAPVRRAG